MKICHPRTSWWIPSSGAILKKSCSRTPKTPATHKKGKDRRHANRKPLQTHRFTSQYLLKHTYIDHLHTGTSEYFVISLMARILHFRVPASRERWIFMQGFYDWKVGICMHQYTIFKLLSLCIALYPCRYIYICIYIYVYIYNFYGLRYDTR